MKRNIDKLLGHEHKHQHRHHSSGQSDVKEIGKVISAGMTGMVGLGALSMVGSMLKK